MQKVQQLDRSWALGLRPDWTSFLLDEQQASLHRTEWVQHTIYVCQVDLNWRLELLASMPDDQGLFGSLITNIYWQALKDRLDLSHFKKLFEMEFQFRWMLGIGMVAERFRLQMPDAVRPSQLVAAWTCPNCETEGNGLTETQAEQQCTHCAQTFTLQTIFPKAKRWHQTNAPKWMLKALADAPPVVGEPGTYGSAYLIADQDTHAQKTVVKVLHPRWTANDDVVHRFLRESKILAILDGEGTPALRRAGRLPDGCYYYQMQWIDGRELREVVQSTDEFVLIDRFEEIVEAIAVAHAHKILHRDISPRNVVIERNRSKAVVLDWGQGRIDDEAANESPSNSQPLAGATSATTYGGTAFHAGFGSPGFQAPELRDNRTPATMSSDVYSLGALMLYCLTRGKTVESLGHSATATKLSSKDSSGNGTRNVLNRMRREGRFSSEVELLDLCEACLELDPSRRPNSAVEVAAQLRTWRTMRQKRVEVLPVVRARNRLAWSMLMAVLLAAILVISLMVAWQKNAETALQAERLLSATRETARANEAESARVQTGLAIDKTREADNAKAFAALLIDVFKSADPLALEGAGYRDTSESVQKMTASELLKRIAKTIDSKSELTPEARAKALDGIGDALRSLGEVDTAETMLLSAERIHNEVSFRGSSADKASLRFHIAILYHDVSNLESAERYYLRALQLTDADQPDMRLRNKIEFRYAWMLADTSRFEAARDLFKKIREERAAALGANHVDTQCAEIAMILMSLHGGDKTELLRQLGAVGESNSMVIEIAKGYVPARFLRESGLNKEAAKAYEALLLKARQVFPTQHPVLGLLLGDMASFYYQIGDQQRTIETAEEAAAIALRTIPAHPLAIDLFNKLGVEYEKQGQFDKAESLYRSVIKCLVNRKGDQFRGPQANFEAQLRRLEALRQPQPN